jgi:hypothetical protein
MNFARYRHFLEIPEKENRQEMNWAEPALSWAGSGLLLARDSELAPGEEAGPRPSHGSGEKITSKRCGLIAQMGIRTLATRYRDQGCYHWATDPDLVNVLAHDNLNQAVPETSLKAAAMAGGRSGPVSIWRFRATQDGEVGAGDAPQRGEADGGDAEFRGSPESRRRRAPVGEEEGHRRGNQPERKKEQEGAGEMQLLTWIVLQVMEGQEEVRGGRN